MRPLRFLLFGGFRVLAEDAGMEIVLSPSSRALLAYLILNSRRPHTRDALLGLFWGDQREDRARACLNSALWRIRRSLSPVAGPSELIVSPSLGTVAVNPAAVFSVDVLELEREIQSVLGYPPGAVPEAALTRLEATLDLYEGDLLAGSYDEWVEAERERVRGLYLAGLTHLMRSRVAHREWGRCARVADRILRVDPFREDVHRELMRIHAAGGHRAAALRQFERCRDLLRRELGVEPEEETVALERALRAGQSPVPPDASMADALNRLSEALRAFDVARGELARGVALVAGLGPGGDPLP